MIGLVNAAGMSDVARAQATEKAAKAVVGGIFVPIQRSEEDGSFRMLRSAIEKAEFSDSSGERKTPEGEESDRFAQAETETRDPTAHLGRFVDMTA